VTALLCASAQAADGPAVNWTGFYLGGHVGAFAGTATFANPAGASIYGDVVATPGFGAGVQAGYNWLAAPQWLLGIEADVSILSASGKGNNTCLQSTPSIIGSNCKATPRETATLTGRLGYLTEPNGRTLLYAKGGGAWMHSDLSINPANALGAIGGYTGPLSGDPAVQNQPSSLSASAWGWTIGAGVEHALSAAWSVKLEYDYLRFGAVGVNTPATISATPDGAVTAVPAGGPSSVTQDMHFAKLGINYRWGVASAPSSAAWPAADSGSPGPWSPGWEFDLGGRYWYSWGKYQGTNGGQNVALSRLTYDNAVGHSGEVFARLDSPYNVFIKGFVGGGILSGGQMIDEDWGIGSATEAEPYSNTRSNLGGSFSYLTADLGYNLLRGRDHKVGVFIGYNRYQISMDATGCAQNVGSAGTCTPAIPTTVNGISETDTWHSLRTGVSAEVQVTERLRLGGDVAFLPYLWVQALDTHHLRSLYFPVEGNGQGVQGEVFLSYRVTDALSLGFGGRYWAMWTTNAYQTTLPSNLFTINTERYGLFAQASWKFGTP
jgi:opacity protein-like surface antigen/outer membrane protease